MSLSPFCYNESTAHEYTPYNQQQVSDIECAWLESINEVDVSDDMQTIHGKNVPPSDQVDDRFLHTAIVCEVS